MKKRTRIVAAGRHPELHQGAVNPPVYHVSTVTYPTVASLKARSRATTMTYGRLGTPTSFAFEEAVCALEGGFRTIATASGLAAITLPLTALLNPGDHLLMVDSIYWPTRAFCDRQLTRFGVEVTYYDPLAGAAIAEQIRPNTRLIFTESPGSLTFEVQDIPAIVAAAHAAGVLVAMDNTWATPLYFDAIAKGVDVSIQAATKYIVGHSDAMLGTVTCAAEPVWERIWQTAADFGQCAGSEEVYFGLRGLRSMAARLAQHQETALALATWMAARPEVARVFYPPLPGDSGHALWKRDFTGASGLFGVELRPCPPAAVEAMLDGLAHFGLGYSWGGFESLAIPTTGSVSRTATSWQPDGPTLRIHAGLEDLDDLTADLDAGFARLRAVSAG